MQKALLQRRYFQKLVFSHFSLFQRSLFYSYIALRALRDSFSSLTVLLAISNFFPAYLIPLTGVFANSTFCFTMTFCCTGTVAIVSTVLNIRIVEVISSKWLAPTYSNFSNIPGNSFIGNEVLSSANSFGSFFGMALEKFFGTAGSMVDHLLFEPSGWNCYTYVFTWVLYAYACGIYYSSNCLGPVFVSFNSAVLFCSLFIIGFMFTLFFLCSYGITKVVSLLSEYKADYNDQMMKLGVREYGIHNSVIFNCQQYWKYDLSRFHAAQSRALEAEKVQLNQSGAMLRSVIDAFLAQIIQVVNPALIGIACVSLSFLHILFKPSFLPATFVRYYQRIILSIMPYMYWKALKTKQQNVFDQLSSIYENLGVATQLLTPDEVSRVKPDDTPVEPMTSIVSPKTISFSIKNLSYSVLGKPLFDNLCFTLEKGKYYLVGKNGLGKTTLSSILLGFLRPENSFLATVKKDNQVYTLDKPSLLRDHVFPVDQRSTFINGTLLENLLLYIRPTEQVMALVHSLVKQLSLAPSLSTYVDCTAPHFSGGQTKKIDFIRTILSHRFRSHKALIFFDEVFAGVDRKSRAIMKQLIEQYLHDTIQIHVTHDVEEFNDQDNILFLNDQKVTSYLFKDLKVLDSYKDYSKGSSFL